MAKNPILIALLPYLLLCTRTIAIIHGTTMSTTISPFDENTNNECGITSYYTDETNRLISNGAKTLPGQWPWRVAIYKLINDELVNEFICAGSVLTTKHVITAAHCLKLKDSNDTINVDNLYIAFGEFTLNQWYERETINRDVASYKIHPDYKHTINGDSDLAILTMRIPIEYSPFIKPICLWSESINFQNITDKTGYVVGWGSDEFGRRNEESRMARVSIVRRAVSGRTQISFISSLSVHFAPVC